MQREFYQTFCVCILFWCQAFLQQTTSQDLSLSLPFSPNYSLNCIYGTYTSTNKYICIITNLTWFQDKVPGTRQYWPWRPPSSFGASSCKLGQGDDFYCHLSRTLPLVTKSGVSHAYSVGRIRKSFWLIFNVF